MAKAVQFDARTREVVDRLRAVDHARPTLDKARVEAALAEHARALGLDPLPVRWIADAEIGHRMAGMGGMSPALIVALATVRIAGWTSRRPRDAAFATEEAVRRAVWSDAERVTLDTAHTAAGRQLWSIPPSPRWSAAQIMAESEAQSWAEGPDGTTPLERYRDVCTPFLDAHEAGLWMHWVSEREILAVPRPAILTAEGRLHCDDGPAVRWEGGARYYFVHGVQVPERVVMRPHELRPPEITGERNVEVRRIMVERYGAARYLHDARARIVHREGSGLSERKLYRLNQRDDEPVAIVRYVNSSPEPIGFEPGDTGSYLRVGKRWYKRYATRVPPSCRTAREAMAWTYGMTAADYAPAVEA